MDGINEPILSFMQQQKTAGLLIIATLYFGFLILVFLISLSFFLRPKVMYIRYLTEGIDEIKKIGFGKNLKVKGKDELAALCQNINEMSITLKEKQDVEEQEEEIKNRLIADISHDIRNTINFNYWICQLNSRR